MKQAGRRSSQVVVETRPSATYTSRPSPPGVRRASVDPSFVVRKTLEGVVDGDPKFLTLNMANCNLQPPDGKDLAEALKAPLCVVRAVDVRNNGFTPDVGRALAKALEVNKSVKSLDLGLNALGPKGCSALAMGLKNNSTLTSLELPLNGVGGIWGNSESTPHGAQQKANPAVVELGEMLRVNTSLLVLDIGYNSLVPGDVVNLVKVLRYNQTLMCLDLGGNHMGVSDATAIADMLRSNTTLTQLDMHSSGMTGPAVTKLCDALRPRDPSKEAKKPTEKAEVAPHNSTLRVLNLADNAFGYQGYPPLCRLLKHNKSITSLDLALNPFGPGAAKALSDGVRYNRTVVELDLSGTCLGDVGVALVQESRNPSLIKLELY